jgi:hypothetical protein
MPLLPCFLISTHLKQANNVWKRVKIRPPKALRVIGDDEKGKAVTDQRAIYSCESSVTLSTERLDCKLQARPPIREGARKMNKETVRLKEEVKSDHGPQRGARHLAWQSAARMKCNS